jgi:hypothetical protein
LVGFPLGHHDDTLSTQAGAQLWPLSAKPTRT